MKQAILAVSFGTSYWNTMEKTIGATERAIAEAFPEWEIRRAFTSGVILKKLQRRDGIHIDTVPEAMEALLAEGYDRVIVQPTHIMHGEEYEKLCSLVKPYQNRVSLSVGMPLLHELSDYQSLCEALTDWLPKPAENEAIVLMGHGSEHFANASYSQMDYMLASLSQPIYIGTVEGYPGLEQIMDRLKARPEVRRVLLAPFMLVAGDHAQNDMAGDENSWKIRLEEQGYQVRCLMRGIGECPAVRGLFVKHCRQALERMESRKGSLYGVGVGPGDPELLTMKAIRILQGSQVVFVPDSGGSRRAALNIVQDYLRGKELQTVRIPMVRDEAVLDEAYTAVADQICELLAEGKQVSYITLGDPSIYSTYTVIHNKVLERGFQAKMVPGVPSFCAAAAALNQSLCEGDQPLIVIPASARADDDLIRRSNKVYMKAGKSILKLQKELRENGELKSASMVENCGMPGERIYPEFEELQEPSGYFSLVISKGGSV